MKHQETDRAMELLFKDKVFAAELINRNIPLLSVRPEDLTLTDTKETAFIGNREKGYHIQGIRDVLFHTDTGASVLFVGVENQSEPNRIMPLRILHYDTNNYVQQLHDIQMTNEDQYRKLQDKRGYYRSTEEFLSRFREEDRLKPCLTIVVYTGREPWTGPRRFSDLFKEKDRKYLPFDFPLTLVDVCRMKEEEVEQYETQLKSVFGLIRYAHDPDGLKKFLEKNRELLQHMPDEAYNVVKAVTKAKVLKKIKTEEKGEIRMSDAFEEYIQKMADIRAEEVGNRRVREMAVAMAKQNVGISNIAVAAGVSESTVRKWVEEDAKM